MPADDLKGLIAWLKATPDKASQAIPTAGSHVANKPIIGKLSAAAVEALADADVRARLATLGQEIFPREQQTPEALAAYHKAGIEKWWPIIKAANIKGE